MRATLHLAFALTLAGPPLHAQRGAYLELLLPPSAAVGIEGPLVRAVNMLSARDTRDLLRSGFPAQLRYRVELWSTAGFLNDLEGAVEWDVVVRQDPLDGSFRVGRIQGNQVALLGRYESVEGAEAAVAVPHRASLRPRRRGQRYYYKVSLEVEILSLSDLDEVERWLKGELRPAVRGRKSAGTALTRGLRTLVIRLLGGETRQYEVRSATFVPR